MSDKDFDNIFKQQLQDLSSTPGAHNWVGIESQLPQKSGKASPWWWATVVLLLLAAVGFMWWQSTQVGHTFYQSQLRAIAGTDYALRFPVSTMARILQQQQQNIPTTSPAGQRAMPETAVLLANLPSNPSEGSSTAMDKTRVSSLRAMPPEGISALPEAFAAMVVNPVFYTESGTLKKHAISGFRVGPAVQWQWSQHTGGPLSTTIGHLEPVAGAAYGLALHYDFNSRWGITAQPMIASTEGVRMVYPSQSSARSDISDFTAQSNYLRIPVLLKYRIPAGSSPRQRPTIWNLEAGVVYGRLNWVNLDDASALWQPQNFNKREWGYALGVSRDWYLGSNYLLSLGVRGAISGHMKTTPFLPLDGNHPATWSVGLHAQFNWLFPRNQ